MPCSRNPSISGDGIGLAVSFGDLLVLSVHVREPAEVRWVGRWRQALGRCGEGRGVEREVGWGGGGRGVPVYAALGRSCGRWGGIIPVELTVRVHSPKLPDVCSASLSLRSRGSPLTKQDRVPECPHALWEARAATRRLLEEPSSTAQPAKLHRPSRTRLRLLRPLVPLACRCGPD